MLSFLTEKLFNLTSSLAVALKTDSSAHTLTFLLSFFVFVALNCLFVFLKLNLSAAAEAGRLSVCLSVRLRFVLIVHFLPQESRTCTSERSASARSCWASRGRRWWWCVTCSPSSTSEWIHSQLMIIAPIFFPFSQSCSSRPAWFQTSPVVKGVRSAHLQHGARFTSAASQINIEWESGEGWRGVMCRCDLQAECINVIIGRPVKCVQLQWY